MYTVVSSICSSIDTQNNLLCEEMNPETRSYNKRKEPMFILTALIIDKIFRMGKNMSKQKSNPIKEISESTTTFNSHWTLR